MQANLNQKVQKKVEIVVIHDGELVHIVTGFLGGFNHEWKVDRKDFEMFIDQRGKRSWSLQYSEGFSKQELNGLMDWDEYYADIRVFEEDMIEFIAFKNSEPLTVAHKL